MRQSDPFIKHSYSGKQKKRPIKIILIGLGCILLLVFFDQIQDHTGILFEKNISIIERPEVKIDKEVTAQTKFSSDFPEKPPPPHGKPLINISSTSLDFGEVILTKRENSNRFIGEKIERPITISNDGNGDLRIKDVINPDPPFRLEEYTCKDILKRNESCAVVFSFFPSEHFSLSEGSENDGTGVNYTSSLEIRTNDRDINITLTGAGKYEQLKTDVITDISPNKKTIQDETLPNDSESNPEKPGVGNWKKSRDKVEYDETL